jgi:hypothetical protein
MKPIYVILALAAALMGTGGIVFWQDYKGSLELQNFPQSIISQLRIDFQSSHSPISTLNTEEIRQSREHKELVDPTLILPHTQKYNFKSISAIFRYAETCKNSPLQKVPEELSKIVIWHEFLCGFRKSLPLGFFESQPYMHPNGESFAQLAVDRKISPFDSIEGAQHHRKYFHVLENDLIIDGIEIQANDLKNILNGEPFFQSSRQTFISKSDNHLDSSTTYAIYSSIDWNQYLLNKPLRTTTKVTKNCILREGNVCWVKSESMTIKQKLRLVVLFLSGLILLAGTLIVQIIRRNIYQNRSREKQKFILQMLTHEIRTPATSLVLSLETLRREFDSLPPDSQEAFLRICDQTQKLTRLIEASKQYLMSDVAGSIQFKLCPVSSLNSWLGSILEKYENEILFQPLKKDRGGNIDLYWLEICVNNLVINAISHGLSPVIVSIQYNEQSKQLSIVVQDQGKLTQKLEEVLVPFHKSDSSSGLGLGLLLVQKIIRAMGGDLQLNPSPTTFSLILKDVI